jgi:hypothetical protein
MEQTAVEWLEEQLFELFENHLPFELLEKAKEIEKQQNQEIRQKSYMEGYDEGLYDALNK